MRGAWKTSHKANDCVDADSSAMGVLRRSRSGPTGMLGGGIQAHVVCLVGGLNLA